MDDMKQYQVKYCRKCKQEKSYDDFQYCARNSDGCSSWCKECKKLYYKRTKKQRMSANYKLYYNITIEQKEEMIRQQKGCCYLCDNVLPDNPKQQHIDHDKETGKIYGIACHHCNTGISFFKHDPYLMVKVAKRMMRLRC